MVSIQGGYRTEFDDKIKEFCQKNGASFNYENDMLGFKMYSINIDSNKSHEFLNYIRRLELERKNERKNMNFWKKMFS